MGVGFGFCDNAIMILAGDFIDVRLGVILGITTLTAAAIGNTCSNVVGLWASGFIETIVGSAGIAQHGLTSEQESRLPIRISKNSAAIAGIVVGCTLGMFPLIFPEDLRLWETREQQED